MSKKEDYILPEGCIAIQIKNAMVDLDVSREPQEDPFDFYADNLSPIDSYLMNVASNSRLALNAITLDDITMLRGDFGRNDPCLNHKNVLIIITDEDA